MGYLVDKVCAVVDLASDSEVEAVTGAMVGQVGKGESLDFGHCDCDGGRLQEKRLGREKKRKSGRFYHYAGLLKFDVRDLGSYACTYV